MSSVGVRALGDKTAALVKRGGPALEHLFITSITPAAPVDGFDAALAGAVFVTQPGVRGIAESAFVH